VSFKKSCKKNFGSAMQIENEMKTPFLQTFSARLFVYITGKDFDALI